MSSAPELAKSARMILSEALSALQSYADGPAALLEVAEPIAQAMGILHAIEKAGGANLDGKDKALSNVRSALDGLQAIDVNHPAVDKATEAVASSLTKLFALARCTPGAPARAAPSDRGIPRPLSKPPPASAPRVPSKVATGAPTIGPAVSRRPVLDITELSGTPTRPTATSAAADPPNTARGMPSAPPKGPSQAVAKPPLAVGPAGTLPVAAPSPVVRAAGTLVVDESPLAVTPRPPQGLGSSPGASPPPAPDAAPAPDPAMAPGGPAAAPPALDPSGPSPQAAAAMGAPVPPHVADEVEAARRALAEAEARAAEEARRLAEARRIAEEKAAEAARAAAEAERQAAEQAAREAKHLQPVPGQEHAPLPAEGVARVNVELGVHSPSNFYKGLAGNDVVDHGGVFVATYKIPKVGTAVALRVLLPGDLEFSADGVVQWSRETRMGDQHPGFGAQFTRISLEGRQLVARYARKREPMFYDDL